MFGLLIITHSCIFAEQMIFEFCSFMNNSDDTLVVAVATNYPDTILPYYDVGRKICLPRQKTAIDLADSRKALFKKASVIQLFVYDKNDLDAFVTKYYPDVDSMGYYRYQHFELRRYELTRDWLEEHDWTVTYP